MSEQQTKVEQFDDWLKDDSPIAALVMRQWLEPVEGNGAVIFPPTYAMPEGTKADDWVGYNIDRFEDGTSVCQIDSVGSQANRMEPIFKRDPYSKLVPQVLVNAGDHRINLLDAGHRAADAVVRFSTLGPQLHEAFVSFQKKGNAEPLARIAPTSIVFGSWDSRATQAKLPRIVRSVIRAYDVRVLHRSAQYTTIAGDILDAGDAEVTTKGPKAELGLAHVPAVHTHGGVQVRGEIRRDATLNLTALRALKSSSEDSLALRRYVLGLALVSFTAPQETFLREGCQLVPAEGRSAKWQRVTYDGVREDLTIEPSDALAFAQVAADAFDVIGEQSQFEFKPGLAKSVMALSEEERKRLFKQGAVTEEAIAKMKTKKGKNSETQVGA